MEVVWEGQMKLSVRRSQRETGLMGSKVVFALDAKIEPTEVERQLIKRYKLGKITIYSSEAAQRHGAALDENLNRGTWGGLAKSVVRLGMAALSLRCTIDSLTSGQHIECQELLELITAEEAIVEACNNAKLFLETAATFDGREVVVEI